MDKSIEKRVFLLKIILLQVFFVLLFGFNLAPGNILANFRSKDNNGVAGVKAEDSKVGLPLRLIIPTIHVDAKIVGVSVNVQGEMETPKTADEVGWFAVGPRPGELGSAVIAGHFDDKSGNAGVFSDLGLLNSGDVIKVEDEFGQSRIFVVKGNKIYDPGYAEDVFAQSDLKHLNLITCDGLWEGDKKSYSKRLVVFADLNN